MSDTKYVCKFERVGRNRNVPDLAVVVAAGQVPADVIADAVVLVARKNLGSPYFCVDVDLAPGCNGSGSIDYGRFGKFSVEVTR